MLNELSVYHFLIYYKIEVYIKNSMLTLFVLLYRGGLVRHDMGWLFDSKIFKQWLESS